MAETSAEVVYVGKGKPNFFEKHTPRAHTEAMMRRYFWLTDHLEGKPREIAEKIRPLIEKSAKLTGWMQTTSELVLAATAVAAVGIVAKNKFKPTLPMVPSVPPPEPQKLTYLGRRPPQVSPGRWEAFSRVTASIDKIPPKPVRKKAPSKIQPVQKITPIRELGEGLTREDLKNIGLEARAAGHLYKIFTGNSSNEASRHFARAVARTLHLVTDPRLSEKLDGIKATMAKDGDLQLFAFQVALKETMPKEQNGISKDEDIARATAAFTEFLKATKSTKGV